MSSGRRATVVALVLMYGACGPDAVVDPTITDGAGGRGGSDVRDTGPERADAGGGTGGGGTGGTGGGGTGGGGTGGAGGLGGMGGSAGAPVDMMVDRPIDQRVDPPDMMLTPDVVEAPPAKMGLLVLADPMNPSAADMQLRTSMMGRGLTPKIVDDNAAADVAGAALVIIAASSDSMAVANKYRDVAVPVMVIEPALFDNMGMTNGDDYGEDNGTQVTIAMAGHPMAAGLTGNVAVLTMTATLTWGAPAASAQRVASFSGMAGRATIFGYNKGAAMVMGMAPARRVGFFAGEPAASRLTDNGKKLLDAAIDWALVP
jgi:hypothetical protein